MKFLIRSGCGESLPIGLRLQNEGHKVIFAISQDGDDYENIGEGLIDKGEYIRRNIDWADIIVFDSNVFELPQEAETLRRQGRHVLGSSQFVGELENDRSFAIKVAEHAGISVPDIKEFSGHAAWDDAERYIKQFSGSKKLVWKPNGEAPASTFVSESVDELIQMIQYWRKLFAEHGHSPNFIITDAIDGEEISTEGWFNGKQLYLPNSTMERTRFFDGDHGEKTGCAGNVVWHNDCPLYHRLFDKLAPVFAGRYNGPIDVNVIIEKDSNEPIFLEFTPRFGYDAFFGLLEVLESDVGKMFYEIACGREVSANVNSAFSGAVRVHIPPYPEPSAEDDKERPIGIPIIGTQLETSNTRGVYPVEVMLKDDHVVTSGPDGYVMVVAGKGSSPREAMEGAYKLLDKIRIPTARWRVDLASKFQEIYNTLLRTGWIDVGGNARNKISIFRRSA